MSTEPTTPRVYVSTSNFRPTLPNFGQEEDEEEEQTSQEEEQEEVVEEPETVVTEVEVPRVPLVLAPHSSTTTTTRTKPTTTTVTTITPATTTTSSSSTSESSFNIHNRLDELASNLDPWAHIQQAAQKVRYQTCLSSQLCNYLSCEINLQTSEQV